MRTIFVLLTCGVFLPVSTARLGTSSSPSGTYEGTKTELGQTLTAKAVINEESFDVTFEATGGYEGKCQGEAYSMKGSAIKLADGSDGCLQKYLKTYGLKLESIKYDSSKDVITIKTKYSSFVTFSVDLKHVQNLVGTENGGGSCTLDDLDRLTKGNFANSMKVCGKKCWGTSACVSDCMTKSVGISKACAACFGAEAQCTRDHCMSKCAFSPDGAACKQCAISNCQAQETKCSGFSPSTIFASAMIAEAA